MSAPEGSVPEGSVPEGSVPEGGAGRTPSATGNRARAHARVALIALTAGTASLDVTAFFRLGGVFASVMTSNLVFVGVAVVKTEAAFGARARWRSSATSSGSASARSSPRPAGTRTDSAPGRSACCWPESWRSWSPTRSGGWHSTPARPAGPGSRCLASSPWRWAARRRHPATGQPQRRHHLPHRHPDFPDQQPGRASSPRRQVGRRHHRAPGRGGRSAALLDAAPITVPLLALAGVGTTVALSWHLRSAHPR